MQNIRRICTLLGILIVAVLIILGCIWMWNKRTVEKTLEEAKVINSNSNLGIEYLLLSTLSEDEAKWFNDDNPETKTTDDGYVTGYFFRYPKKSGEKRLTQIRITSGDYNILGIMLKDNIDDAAEILKQNGYRETKATTLVEGVNTKEFKKYNVIIKLETEVDSYEISSMSVLTDT